MPVTSDDLSPGTRDSASIKISLEPIAKKHSSKRAFGFRRTDGRTVASIAILFLLFPGTRVSAVPRFERSFFFYPRQRRSNQLSINTRTRTYPRDTRRGGGGGGQLCKADRRFPGRKTLRNAVRIPARGDPTDSRPCRLFGAASKNWTGRESASNYFAADWNRRRGPR